MSTLKRLERLMSSLDPERRRGLLEAVRKLDGAIAAGSNVAGQNFAFDSAGRVLHGIDRLMDLAEADFYVSAEIECVDQRQERVHAEVDAPELLLAELERWVIRNRPVRPRDLPAGTIRSRTVRRIEGLMPRLDGFLQDNLFDVASRLTRSWRGGWEELEPWERTVGVWRILAALNEQMDSMERGMKELLEFEVAKSGSGGVVTREMAVQIATRERNVDLAGLPDGWTSATKVTDEPPVGLYRVWDDEPAWYVWLLPRFVGLGSSEVVVVSKRTGRVVGSGSTGDEG